MTRAVVLICLLFLKQFLFAQDIEDHDGNRLYDHNLDEDKWEKIRENIRYEGHKDALIMGGRII